MSWFGKKQDEPVTAPTPDPLAEFACESDCKCGDPECWPKAEDNLLDTPKANPIDWTDSEVKNRNLQILHLAFQIEEATRRSKVFYIDVGNLPKAKAEEYVKSIMDKFPHSNKPASYYLPRREGGRGTEYVVSQEAADVDSVIAIATKLKEFINS